MYDEADLQLACTKLRKKCMKMVDAISDPSVDREQLKQDFTSICKGFGKIQPLMRSRK